MVVGSALADAMPGNLTLEWPPGHSVPFPVPDLGGCGVAALWTYHAIIKGLFM